MKKNIAFISICFVMAFALAGSASAATLSLNSGTTIALGAGNVVVSGTCNDSPIHVPIVLTQGNSSTTVALATRPDNGQTGNYIGYANFALNVDAGFTTGPATLTAVCPEGNASVAITLIDPDPASNTGNNNNNNSGNNTNTGNNTGNNNNNNGDVGGVSNEDTTPVGGVAAGKMSGLNLVTLLGAALMLAGGVGLVYGKNRELGYRL